jgi:hypothetical protein
VYAVQLTPPADAGGLSPDKEPDNELTVDLPDSQADRRLARIQAMPRAKLQEYCRELDTTGLLTQCAVHYPGVREHTADQRNEPSPACCDCCAATSLFVHDSCRACVTTQGGKPRDCRWLVTRPIYVFRYAARLVWWLLKLFWFVLPRLATVLWAVLMCKPCRKKNVRDEWKVSLFTTFSKCGVCTKWAKPTRQERATSVWWTLTGRLTGALRIECCKTTVQEELPTPYFNDYEHISTLYMH